MLYMTVHQQAISKFESLVNQIQKNAKDINSRLEMLENAVLFKQPPPKMGGILPDAKVSALFICLHCTSNHEYKQRCSKNDQFWDKKRHLHYPFTS